MKTCSSCWVAPHRKDLIFGGKDVFSPFWLHHIVSLGTFRTSQSLIRADRDYFTAALIPSLCKSLRGSLKRYYLPSHFHLLLLRNVFILTLLWTKAGEKYFFKGSIETYQAFYSSQQTGTTASERYGPKEAAKPTRLQPHTRSNIPSTSITSPPPCLLCRLQPAVEVRHRQQEEEGKTP